MYVLFPELSLLLMQLPKPYALSVATGERFGREDDRAASEILRKMEVPYDSEPYSNDPPEEDPWIDKWFPLIPEFKRVLLRPSVPTGQVKVLVFDVLGTILVGA
jgi:hypothetical protein